jgi:Domain of unknown function (DUF4342)
MTEEHNTFGKELQVAGKDLVTQIQELVRQGNARRVTVHAEDGHELLSVPLTVGVVAGGLVTLSAPVLAGLGALAALVSHVRLVVTHEPETHEPEPSPSLEQRDETGPD